MKRGPVGDADPPFATRGDKVSAIWSHTVTEAGCMGDMNHREIGHGSLPGAHPHRAIRSAEDFPCAIVVGSEACDSNGSGLWATAVQFSQKKRPGCYTGAS